jgi:hypothetical protein
VLGGKVVLTDLLAAELAGDNCCVFSIFKGKKVSKMVMSRWFTILKTSSGPHKI